MKILSNGKLVDLPEDHPLYMIFEKVKENLEAKAVTDGA